MCRIISFVSATGGLGKSSVIFLLAKSLSERGKRVCVFDGVFALNNLSNKFDGKMEHDLCGYLMGDIGSFDVLNKASENLYYVKSDNAAFDYKLKAELISRLIKDISFKFDYILIETSSYDSKNIELFLSISTEANLIVSQDESVLKNSKKLLQKLLYFRNIKNIKIILNNRRVIGELNGKAIGEKFIEAYLRHEVIFSFPKFLKYNIFSYGIASPEYKSFSEKFAESIISNERCEVNYMSKYLGFSGRIRRKLYEKFE